VSRHLTSAVEHELDVVQRANVLARLALGVQNLQLPNAVRHLAPGVHGSERPAPETRSGIVATARGQNVGSRFWKMIENWNTVFMKQTSFEGQQQQQNCFYSKITSDLYINYLLICLPTYLIANRLPTISTQLPL